MLLFRLFRQCRSLGGAGFSRLSAAGLSSGAVRQGAAGVSVMEEGRKMRATWKGEGGPDSFTYHSVWLRRNCQCPQCLNTQNQNIARTDELDPHVTVSSANISSDGSELMMKWSCGHEGHLNLDWLKRNNYSSKTLEKGRKDITPLFVTQATLPRMDYKELEDDYGVWKWLKNVNEYGVCLLHGVPCTKETSFEVSRKICPYLQENFFGGFSDVKVEEAVSVAYGPGPLEPHMDIPMYESHVGITLLHCLRNDECVTGGLSLIVDGLAVVEKLRVTHPHHFDTLVRVPTTFQRIYDSEDHPVHMVYRTPHIHLNGHGQVIKFRWAPHHGGPLQANEEDVEPYYEAYTQLGKLINNDKEFQISYKMKPGDLFTLNNQRMVHGRTEIQLNGGGRHITNIAMNIDEFKSRFHWLCTKHAPDYQPRNVLNDDFSFSTYATIAR